MSAAEYITAGIILTVAGVVLLAVSQWVLTRWHTKVLSEL